MWISSTAKFNLPRSALNSSNNDIQVAAYKLSMRPSQFAATMERLRRLKPRTFTFTDSAHSHYKRGLIEYANDAKEFDDEKQSRRRLVRTFHGSYLSHLFQQKKQRKEIQKEMRDIYKRERQRHEQAQANESLNESNIEKAAKE